MDYVQAREKERSNADIIGQKRQEKALREFKHVLEDLVFLLRKATGMETVYMYWVNRSREQFVLETKSTAQSNVRFQDRVNFDDHFLNSFKDIDEPFSLQVGDDLYPEDLSHYFEEVPIKYITLLPFLNNGETVALTILESKDQTFSKGGSEVIYSYIDALRNVLNTYLEISDLYEKEDEWNEYEASLEVLNSRAHRADLVQKMLNEMQRYLQKGSVSLVARGMQSWCNILNSKGAYKALPVGTTLEERTLAHDVMQKGSPEFSIHFNNNPKRISPREYETDGASLAIPFLFNDRRQGVVLVHDKNPLIFKESTKHKFINMVRMTSLRIQANNGNLDIDKPFLTNEYEAFLPDVWERIIETELENIEHKQQFLHTWMGLITLSNLSSLRTRLRLEDLHHLQKDLVSRFNPGRFGVTGIIGSHADYVYSFVIQSTDQDAVKYWTNELKAELSNPVELSNGLEIDTSIKVGFTRLDSSQKDSYQVLSHAKTALSRAMSSDGEKESDSGE